MNKSRTFQISATLIAMGFFWYVVGRFVALYWLLIHPPVKGWLEDRQAELAPYFGSSGMVYVPGTGRNDFMSQLIGDSVSRPTFFNLHTDTDTWIGCYTVAFLITAALAYVILAPNIRSYKAND